MCRLASGAPDLRCCLLHQKLQVASPPLVWSTSYSLALKTFMQTSSHDFSHRWWIAALRERGQETKPVRHRMETKIEMLRLRRSRQLKAPTRSPGSLGATVRRNSLSAWLTRERWRLWTPGRRKQSGKARQRVVCIGTKTWCCSTQRSLSTFLWRRSERALI